MTRQLQKLTHQYPHASCCCTVKKPCRNAPNSNVDNGCAEPNDVGVGFSDPHVVWFAPTLSTSEFREAFFLQCVVFDPFFTDFFYDMWFFSKKPFLVHLFNICRCSISCIFKEIFYIFLKHVCHIFYTGRTIYWYYFWLASILVRHSS